MEGWHEVISEIIKHSWEPFNKLCYLPSFNYPETFILIDLIKTHDDYKNWTDVIQCLDDHFDFTIDLPELAHSFMLAMYVVVVLGFVEVLGFGSVH